MKLTKDKIVNLVIILFIGILLFTPIGFQFKVLVNKIISFSPSEIKKENQVTLTNYNWHLVDSKGIQVDFNSFKNKVVVLNSWATWCPPCVAEMPEFQKLHTDYQDKVSFLFVAHDEKQKVDAFMAKKGYDLPIFYENSTAPEEFQSKSIPKTFVVDKKGNIIISETGVAEWNGEKMRSLLDKLVQED